MASIREKIPLIIQFERKILNTDFKKSDFSGKWHQARKRSQLFMQIAIESGQHVVLIIPGGMRPWRQSLGRLCTALWCPRRRCPGRTGWWGPWSPRLRKPPFHTIFFTAAWEVQTATITSRPLSSWGQTGPRGLVDLLMPSNHEAISPDVALEISTDLRAKSAKKVLKTFMDFFYLKNDRLIFHQLQAEKIYQNHFGFVHWLNFKILNMVLKYHQNNM